MGLAALFVAYAKKRRRADQIVKIGQWYRAYSIKEKVHVAHFTLHINFSEMKHNDYLKQKKIHHDLVRKMGWI